MSRRLRLTAFVAAGLGVAAVLALVVSPHASSEPDGLERVAVDEGFADRATDHALADGPTADYAVDGVDDEGLSTGIAGLLGVAVTFAVAGGLFLALRRFGGGTSTSVAGPGAGPPGSVSGAGVERPTSAAGPGAGPPGSEPSGGPAGAAG